jgi:pimeloyl-ACP methyl ester carboxylesterase
MIADQLTFTGWNGLKIHAIAKGPTNGPPVLLAHGGGQTHWAWRRTVEALASGGFRAIAIDLRGHGQSEWARDGDYHYTSFARDLLAITATMPAKPAMVGASLGGIAGMIAEGDLTPGTFSSLTLVDITARPDKQGVARITGFMRTHMEDGFASPEEAAEAIGGYTPNRPKRGPSDSLRRYLRKGADGRFRWHWDPAFMTSVDIDSGDDPERKPRAARSLKLPVHLVRGGSSDLVPVEAAREFIEMVPHAHFTDIAGAGHMVVGDRNDVFSDAIVAFLSD